MTTKPAQLSADDVRRLLSGAYPTKEELPLLPASLDYRLATGYRDGGEQRRLFDRLASCEGLVLAIALRRGLAENVLAAAIGVSTSAIAKRLRVFALRRPRGRQGFAKRVVNNWRVVVTTGTPEANQSSGRAVSPCDQSARSTQSAT